MKILLLHNYYRRSSISGENIVVDQHVELLKRVGHEVKLISRESDEILNSKAKWFAIGIQWVLNLGFSPVKEIRKFKPDVIFFHNLYPRFQSRWLKKNRIPCIQWLHNYRFICMAGTNYRDDAFCNLCSSGVNLISVKSRCANNSLIQSVANFIRLFFRFNQPEIDHLNHFVVLSPMQLRHFKNSELSSKKFWLIPNFGPMAKKHDSNLNGKWLYLGGITKGKGILTLIRNLPTSLNLDVYGDGPLLQELLKLIEGKSNVQYGGTLPRNSISQTLSMYTGLFVPSTWSEALPTVLLESLSVGLPVIVHKANSCSDYVRNFHCGLVLDDFDEEIIYKRCSEIEANWLKFNENATIAYKKLFTEEIWLSNLREMLEFIGLEN